MKTCGLPRRSAIKKDRGTIMALLKCKDLTLGYENIELVKGLNFEVNKGEYLCIVGENGAGKSTLMKTILKLRKPLAGSVIYDDGLKSTEIGYLPQQTIVQKDFPASVFEVVLSGCQSHLGRRLFYNSADKERALSNMKRLGIENLKKHCYRELSGGQQQRILLARALCATESMLLLDEPVSGLDPKVTLEMYDLIRTLNKEGITIIMISHDIQSAVRYSSHILHMGAEIFYGTTKEYQDSDEGKKYLIDNNGGDHNA